MQQIAKKRFSCFIRLACSEDDISARIAVPSSNALGGSCFAWSSSSSTARLRATSSSVTSGAGSNRLLGSRSECVWQNGDSRKWYTEHVASWPPPSIGRVAQHLSAVTLRRRATRRSEWPVCSAALPGWFTAEPLGLRCSGTTWRFNSSLVNYVQYA